MLTRGFLLKAKKKALRKGYWYGVVDRVERGMYSLACRVCEEVRSLALARQLLKILAKLRNAGKSGFVRHMEGYGLERARKVSRLGKELGCRAARSWSHDFGFIRYLTMLDYYKPSGWGI